MSAFGTKWTSASDKVRYVRKAKTQDTDLSRSNPDSIANRIKRFSWADVVFSNHGSVLLSRNDVARALRKSP